MDIFNFVLCTHTTSAGGRVTGKFDHICHSEGNGIAGVVFYLMNAKAGIHCHLDAITTSISVERRVKDG